MSPPAIDLSFARYVAARKGLAAARRREGAAYAYGGDLRLRGWLERVRPVTLALLAARRHFRTVGREKVLAGAVRVDERHFPTVAEAVNDGAALLALAAPTTYVVPDPGAVEVTVLGSEDEPLVLVPARLVDGLAPGELRAALAGALGAVQNGHVEYQTALWALASADDLVARWAGAPARAALERWALRAAVTTDRAALIVTRDRGVTAASLVRRTLGRRRLLAEVDVPGFLATLDERGRTSLDEPDAHRARLGARLVALDLFARTPFFRGVMHGPGAEPGADPPLTKEDVDLMTGALLGEAA